MTRPHRLRLLLGLALLVPLLSAQHSPEGDFQPEVGHLRATPQTPPARIRIVTFNVHHGADVPALAEAIRANPALREADVFLLQEIENHAAEGASRTRKLAQTLELNYVYAPARRTDLGGTHGLAILSRFPLEAIEVLPLKQFDLNYNTRRRIALGATVNVGGRLVRLYNVHLDTRINTRDRLEQLRPVAEAGRQYSAGAAVIGGDFNTNPMRWAFHVLPVFRANQAQAVDELMEKNGFTTPFAAAGSTSRKPVVRFRLDSLYQRGLSVTGYGIERSVTVSDHLPLWMDVAWPAAPAKNP